MVAVGICLASATVLFQYLQYVSSGAYLDHIESSVLIPGYNYLHGRALYEIQDGAPRLATFYGPLAYLIHSLALATVGPYIISGKIFSGLALLGTVTLLVWHFRRHATFGPSCNGVFMLLAGLTLFYPVTIWIRPDPFEMMLVAVAVVAANRRWGVIGLGASIGLAVNFKIHAFFYFLPVIFELYGRGGLRSLARAAGVAGIIFLIPFLLPGISLSDYVTVLSQQVGGRAPELGLLVPAIWAMLLLCFPIVFALVSEQRDRPRKDLAYVRITIGTVILLIYPATFPGAGPYHFMPLLPVLAEAYMRAGPSNIRARLFPWIILLNGLHIASYNLAVPRMVSGWQVTTDQALALAQTRADRSVEIGYGDNLLSYNIAQLSRVVLTLKDYPPSIDAQVLMELASVGVDGSKRWLPYLTQCQVGLWLLPAGERPFAMAGYYGKNSVFSEAFQQAFTTNYRRTSTAGYFDLWECAHGPAR